LNPKTTMRYAGLIAATLAIGACASMEPSTPQGKMTFFVTSVNPGKGADLGGLAGADAHCQALASAVGAGKRTWRAYLSTTSGGQPLVNARDRIGSGPWQNVKGDVIATSVDNLHADSKLGKQTSLTEKGDVVPSGGDPVNMHDILTGSQPDGRGIAGNVDSTCSNWTSSTTGAAMVGHSNRAGLDESVPAKSWNSSHQSRGGCSMDALKSTGGAGLFYCFAVN
jgi:hypothetical protein